MPIIFLSFFYYAAVLRKQAEGENGCYERKS